MVNSETYQIIQEWITKQQEYEATHSSPAPLTDTQRKLLEKLQVTLPPLKRILPEPELGQTNWVGILQEYQAARKRISTAIDFSESPGPVVKGVQNWYCQVRVDEHPTPFPGPQGGLLDGTQPCFARKKDAKKYAAMCAVEYLMAYGFMRKTSANGAMSTQFPVQPAATQSPPSKRAKLTTPSPEQPKAMTSKPEPDVAKVQPGNPLPKGTASPFNDEEVSAAHEVSKLCNRLGQPGFPQYHLDKNEGMPDFYSGYPNLGVLGTKLPQGIGRVENVFGRKAAKEQIAEKLLDPLRKLATSRDGGDEQVIASLHPVKNAESPA
ncbi:hypothetical protein GGR54DRAFT_583864 [Hypoxylon sp. NC1633]|nr:hypothetical protein GGR54DRAFT_583864 [Hypoxylon sp. NC1633]